MYIDSLIYGIEFQNERIDIEYRKKLNQMAEEEGLEQLYEKAKQIDPDAMRKISINDKKRIIRVLEIYHKTGKTKTEQEKESRKNEVKYNYKTFAITMNREKLYERIELWNKIEEIFDINDEENVYWRENSVRAKANAEFRLGNEEKATKIIEDYLKAKPEWAWGYIEMADWYLDKRDKKHYDLERAKSILLRAENIKGIEEVDAVLER